MYGLNFESHFRKTHMNTTKEKILVVDDELIIRKLVSAFLSQHNYDVSTAENGIEALKMADEQAFDLILSDLHMPVMEGDELIREMKSKPEYKYTPFLFLSGDSNKDTWLRNLNAGADDFILKPFDKEILLTKIKANLKKFNLRKELIKSNKKKHLNEHDGKIIIITTPSQYIDYNKEEITLPIAFMNIEDFSVNTLNNENIWLIIVDESQITELDKVKKVVKSYSDFISISVAVKSIEHSKIGLDTTINTIIKSKDKSITSGQINAIIRRENLIKSKYFQAVKMAANNSFIRFEYDVNLPGNFTNICIKHQPFDNIPGGDFYEIFTMNEHARIIVLGDVMGKKWDAWFFVSSYISYIRSLIKLLANQHFNESLKQPSTLLENLNQFIYKDAQLSEVFTTLSIIMIDDHDKTVKISSAGAQKPLFFDGEKVSTLNIIGTLLGIIKDVEYQELEIHLKPKQALLLFTDGYNEASNSITGEMLENSDIADALKNNVTKSDVSAQSIENYLIQKHHIQGFDDDRTMLLLKAH